MSSCRRGTIIHAVANLLRAPVVVVDVRFASMAGLFAFAPGYEPQKLIGKRRAAELRLNPQLRSFGSTWPSITFLPWSRVCKYARERACGALKSGVWARGEREAGRWVAGFWLLRGDIRQIRCFLITAICISFCAVGDTVAIHMVERRIVSRMHCTRPKITNPWVPARCAWVVRARAAGRGAPRSGPVNAHVARFFWLTTLQMGCKNPLGC